MEMGGQTRDFIYVEDAAEANTISLEEDVLGTFNIGSSVEVSINSLANMIIKLTNSNSTIVYKEPRPRDISRSIANAFKAQQVLG